MSDELMIEYADASKLKPSPDNPRTHPPEQIAHIQASMLEFGWTNPILADDTGIIAGHGRLEAAQGLWKNGKSIPRCPKGKAPTIFLNDLTPEQRTALIIADNQTALGAEWNLDALADQLRSLAESDFGMEALGFDFSELDRLLKHGQETEGLTEPDDVPDPPGEPVSRPGDVWLLGDHRLCCGDATSADDVAKLLGKVRPHLMVTDPPYGIEYDASWRGKAKNADGSPLSTGEDRATGKVKNDDRADWFEAYDLFPGDVVYVWHAGLKSTEVAESMERAGFQIRAQIIWNKNNFAVSRGHYHPKHEPCWYAVRKGKTGHWAGDRKQSTVWDIDKPKKSETGHSTQKPVECMKRPIENNSSPGQAVYEPFNGSGTTIIACEQTGRVCYAMELNPLYIDTAILRWQNFTGQNATLEATGETYTEAMGQRAPDNVLSPAKSTEGKPAARKRKPKAK